MAWSYADDNPLIHLWLYGWACTFSRRNFKKLVWIMMINLWEEIILICITWSSVQKDVKKRMGRFQIKKRCGEGNR